MPLFDFLCTEGHRTSQLFDSLETRPEKCICWKEGCTQVAHSVIAPVQFRIKGQGAPMDRARDIWEGTGIDTDGVNPYQYESEKIHVDMGHTGRRHRPQALPPCSLVEGAGPNGEDLIV